MKGRVKATNTALNALFQDIDCIHIKKDGVSKGRALSDEIVLIINDPSKIRKFNTLMKIKEPEEDFMCLCQGNYAIELLNQGQLKSIIGYHHGDSIRYCKWSGDADLLHSEELIQFLYDLGLTSPLEEKLETELNNTIAKNKYNHWINHSPKCFEKYLNFPFLNKNKLKEILNDLKIELKNENAIILALLKSFGASKNLWTAFPVYEMIPQNVLNTFTINDILNAYALSNNDHLTTIGLGRHLLSWEYRKYLKKIKLPQQLLESLLEAFVEINDWYAIEKIDKMLQKAQ